MKKIFVSLLLLAFASAAMAQSLTMTPGPIVKGWKVKNDACRETGFIGADNTHAYLTIRHNKAGKNGKYSEVVRYGLSDMMPTASCRVHDEDDLLNMGGFLVDDEVVLLYAKRSEGKFEMFRHRLNATTLAPLAEMEQIYETACVPNAIVYPTYRASHSADLQAILYLVSSKTEGTSAYLALYSTAMEELWGMDVDDIALFSDFFVTDSGAVVTYGMQATEDGIKLEFHVLDGATDQAYEAEIDDKDLFQVQMGGYVDGKMLLTGFTSDRKQMVGITYNTATKKISIDRMTVPVEEVCVYGNYPKVKDAEEEGISDWVRRCCYDYDNKGMTAGYYVPIHVYGDVNQEQEIGMLCVRLGADGKLKWIKGIQRATTTPTGAPEMLFNRMICVDGKTFCMMPERAAFAKENSKYRSVPYFPMLKDANTIAYIKVIDEQGKITDQSQIIPKGLWMVGAPHRVSSNRWIQFAMGTSTGTLLDWRMK